MAEVAEALVDKLIENGVERVCGFPGDSRNSVTDAIR
jgi:pyruvate dehydrogenase (quinone)